MDLDHLIEVGIGDIRRYVVNEDSFEIVLSEEGIVSLSFGRA